MLPSRSKKLQHYGKWQRNWGSLVGHCHMKTHFRRRQRGLGITKGAVLGLRCCLIWIPLCSIIATDPSNKIFNATNNEWRIEDLVSKLVGLATLSFAAFLLTLSLNNWPSGYKGISSQTLFFFFSSSFFFLSVISTYKYTFFFYFLFH